MNQINTRQLNTILCADDDPDDLLLLKEAIKAVDPKYQIIEAKDGLDALNTLRELKAANNLPCLIVLDINMPKMDGRQTFVTIKEDEVLATVPIVIFSTSSSELDKMFFEKKHVEYITKPIDYNIFLEVARKLLSYCT